MSRAIICDSCRKTMYEDSRSGKDDYHEFVIDHQLMYHMCANCFNKFMKDMLHQKWSSYDNCWLNKEELK